jgi:DNA-binding NtrC family response regulator
MEPDIQVKLLRALEGRAFRRLGGKKEISVDIRVISATNRDLAKALKDGDLREDLYHRLAVVPIVVPPLRDRARDIRLLAETFLRAAADDMDKAVEQFDDSATEYMETYRWPGNVRELKNAVERAVILAKGSEIHASDLKPRHLELEEGEVHIPVGTSLEDSERLVALKTFAFSGGDHAKAARILGIEEEALRTRLQHWLAQPEAVV